MGKIAITPHFGEVGLAVPQFERVRPSDTLAAGIGEGLGVAAQITDRMADEEADREGSNTALAAQTAIEDFKDKLRGRQDYGAFGPEFKTFADQWKAQNLQGLSVRGRQRVAGRIDQMFGQGTGQVRDLAWATQVDVSRADLSRFIDDSFKLVGKGGQAAVDALHGIAGRIDGAEGAGFLTASQAEELRQNTKERYGVLTASTLIDQDPYGAKKALAGGQFDQYLTPEKKLQLQDAADREIKRREAEARAAQREAQADYMAGFQDELAFVADGGVVTDSQFSRDNLVKVFGAEKGGQLADTYERAATTGQVSKQIATMTDAEVKTLLEQTKAELDAGPEDYKAKAGTMAAYIDAAKAREKALADDPAGYVQQNFPTVKGAFDAYAASGDAADLKKAVQLTLDIQDQIGVPLDKQQPLAKQAAAGIAAMINDAGSAQKQLEAVGSLLELGDDATVRRVLAQVSSAGAPAVLPYVAENLKNGDTAAATRLLGVSTGEQPKVPTGTDGKDMREKAASAYSDDQENLALQAGWTGDGSRLARAQGEAELVTKLALTNGNYGQAVTDVRAGLQPVTDDRLAAVHAPLSVDPDGVLAGLATLRERALTADAFVGLLGPAGNTVAQKIGADVADQAREDARWVDYGEGYALVLPGQVYLADDKGKVRVFMLDDVMAAATGGLSEILK